MSRKAEPTVYVNGAFVPQSQAMVSVFDRGFLFADAVYEVTTVLRGKLIDNAGHLARLQRSLKALSIPLPQPLEDIEAVQQELIRRNDMDEGIVYLQVTRGTAERSFDMPDAPQPSLIGFCQHKAILSNPLTEQGLHIITTPDLRWARRDIKTVGLLAQSLAKTEATSRGVDDVWMVEDGFVTEGSSSNAYIVLGNHTIVTRPKTKAILHGITRETVLRIAAQAGYTIEERPFSVAEAQAAHEAFISSASTFVLPVTSIDGKAMGNAKPGPVTRDLRQRYIDAALSGKLG